MKKITLLLFILFAAGHAEAMHKRKKKKKTVQKTNTVVAARTIKSVLMGKGACFGTCPIYDIEVFDNGTIRYTGKQFVDKQGVYEKHVDPQETMKIINEVASYRPDTCADNYKVMIPDVPHVHFFISYKDSVKRIVNADSGPYFFRELTILFDPYVNIDESWQKINTEEKK
jgi:hypothetical protein